MPLPKTWAEHKSTLPTKQHCFLGRPARRGSLGQGLFLGGGCVQDHLDAGLAAQSGVDGQIIVVGIAPAVLGVVVVVGSTVAVGLVDLVLEALFLLGLQNDDLLAVS